MTVDGIEARSAVNRPLSTPGTLQQTIETREGMAVFVAFIGATAAFWGAASLIGRSSGVQAMEGLSRYRADFWDSS